MEDGGNRCDGLTQRNLEDGLSPVEVSTISAFPEPRPHDLFEKSDAPGELIRRVSHFGECFLEVLRQQFGSRSDPSILSVAI